jgi:hypothetical protein
MAWMSTYQKPTDYQSITLKLSHIQVNLIPVKPLEIVILHSFNLHPKNAAPEVYHPREVTTPQDAMIMVIFFVELEFSSGTCSGVAMT